MNIGDIIWQRKYIFCEGKNMSDVNAKNLPYSQDGFTVQWVDCFPKDRLFAGLTMPIGDSVHEDCWYYAANGGVVYRYRKCTAEYLMACMAEGNVQ